MADRRPNDETLDPAEYPSGYDVPSLEARRYRWTARLFAVVACASLGANVALSMAIYSLAPLKTREPFLVEMVDKDNVVATIEPISTMAPGFLKMTELLARQYVVLRNEIVRSNLEMVRRWGPNGPLRLMETNDETTRFADEIKDTYQKLRQAGVTREVHVTSSNPLPSPERGHYLFLVSFNIVERDASEQVLRRASFDATLDCVYLPKKVVGDEAFVNPTGFTVVAYSVAEKSTAPSSDQKAPQ